MRLPAEEDQACPVTRPINGLHFYPVFHSDGPKGPIGVTLQAFDANDLWRGIVDLVLPREDVGNTVAVFMMQWSEDLPRWEARGSLGLSRGSLVVASLTLHPVTGDEREFEFAEDEIPPGGVSSGALRRVPLRLVLNAAEALLSWADRSEDIVWREFADALRGSAHLARSLTMVEKTAPVGSRRRGGRTPLPAEFLRNIACAWLEEGVKPGAHARMAQRFHSSKGAIRDALRAARREGWLEPSLQGRRSALAGPRLRAEKVM